VPPAGGDVLLEGVEVAHTRNGWQRHGGLRTFSHR
jgi:hypothetical protein